MSADLYIGLISGTSADGVNAALVSFESQHPTLVHSLCLPYPTELRCKITGFFEPGDDAVDALGQLDVEVGRFFASTARQLLELAGVSAADICAIGSHGQTIRHRPDFPFPFTMQIGDPNTIAELTGITTVADFRRRDMAAGGQAAPLVPGFHQAVFRAADRRRAVVNIGGIGNVTLLAPLSPLLGFDSGPGNGLLDAWCATHQGRAFDENGNWSRQGRIIPALLDEWKRDSYFSRQPPKSTGKEEFNSRWLWERTPQLAQHAPVDVAATLVELTAWSIYDAIDRFCGGVDELFVCGGGAHNGFLMQQLAKLSGRPVASTSALGIDPDWVEAMAFAWLAHARLATLPGNVASVTGASGPRILGGIYHA